MPSHICAQTQHEHLGEAHTLPLSHFGEGHLQWPNADGAVCPTQAEQAELSELGWNDSGSATRRRALLCQRPTKAACGLANGCTLRAEGC